MFLDVDRSMDGQKAFVSDAEGIRGETLPMSECVQSKILNEALELSHVMRKFKRDSDQVFKLVNKRFEEARKTDLCFL